MGFCITEDRERLTYPLTFVKNTNVEARAAGTQEFLASLLLSRSTFQGLKHARVGLNFGTSFGQMPVRDCGITAAVFDLENRYFGHTVPFFRVTRYK